MANDDAGAAPSESEIYGAGASGAPSSDAAGEYGYAPPPAPAAPPPKKRSPAIYAVVAVVVAVIVVLAVLFFAGIGPFHRNSGSGSTTELTYSQAASAANSTDSSYAQGTWSPFFVFGFAFATPGTLDWQTIFTPGLFSAAGITCGGTFVDAQATVLLPAYTGDVSNGQAPVWLFFSENGVATAQAALLLTAVINGTATVWEKYTGLGCQSLTSVENLALPSGGQDSSDALLSVLTGGGGTFLSAHPHGSMYYSQEGAAFSGSGASVWDIVYSTCPDAGSPVSGTTYYTMYSNVSATSGSMIGQVTSGATDCSTFRPITTPTTPTTTTPPTACTNCPPLSGALTIQANLSMNARGEWAATVKFAATGLTLADVRVLLENSTGAFVSTSIAYSFELDSASGCGLAVGPFDQPASNFTVPSSNACSSGTGLGAAISTGDYFIVDSAGTNATYNDTFIVEGWTHYSGNVTCVLGR